MPTALHTASPSWFASVMGTGILADALVLMPVDVPGRRALALVLWLAAAAWLLVLLGVTVRHRRREPAAARAQLRDPLVAPLYGAPAMALLTVGAGALLAGRGLLGEPAAVAVAGTLWAAGTALGLAVAAWVPLGVLARELRPGVAARGRDAGAPRRPDGVRVSLRARGRRRLGDVRGAPRARGRRRLKEVRGAPRARGRRRLKEVRGAPRTRGRRRLKEVRGAPRAPGRRRLEEVRPTWLLPVVSPLVSATTSAGLVAHLPAGAPRAALLGVGYGLAAGSLLAALVVLALLAARLRRHGVGERAAVPTLLVVLGPLGQSVTAVNVLGAASRGVVPAGTHRALHVLGLAYGVPVLLLALVWLLGAGAVVVRELRRGLPFTLSWWSLTFPVGTCVTGASALAAQTGAPVLAALAVALLALLVLAWATVAARTARLLAGDAPSTTVRHVRSADPGVLPCPTPKSTASACTTRTPAGTAR